MKFKFKKVEFVQQKDNETIFYAILISILQMSSVSVFVSHCILKKNFTKFKNSSQNMNMSNLNIILHGSTCSNHMSQDYC